MKREQRFWKWVGFATLLIVILVFVIAKKPKHEVPEPLLIDRTLMDRLTGPLVLDLEYRLSAELESGLQGLRGIAIDLNDYVYLVGADALRVIKTDGSFVREWPISKPATCVDVDDDGDVYVGHETSIDVFDNTGQLVRSWGREGKGPGELSFVTGIAISGPNVFLADAGNRCVHRFDLTGDYIDDIGKPNEEKGVDGIVCPSPWLDLDVDPDGLILVTNPGRARVEQYKFDGTLVAYWGEVGMRTQDFFGCCNPVNLSVLPENRLVTAEKLVSRVKVYDIHGKLLAKLTSGFSEQKNTGLDIGVDSSGRILVINPDNGRVSVFAQKDY